MNHKVPFASLVFIGGVSFAFAMSNVDCQMDQNSDVVLYNIQICVSMIRSCWWWIWVINLEQHVRESCVLRFVFGGSGKFAFMMASMDCRTDRNIIIIIAMILIFFIIIVLYFVGRSFAMVTSCWWWIRVTHLEPTLGESIWVVLIVVGWVALHCTTGSNAAPRLCLDGLQAAIGVKHWLFVSGKPKCKDSFFQALP